jgi:hypothetical protein
LLTTAFLSKTAKGIENDEAKRKEKEALADGAPQKEAAEQGKAFGLAQRIN